MPDIDERVSDLEQLMMKLAYMQVNTQIQIDRLTLEMKEFKNDMRQNARQMNRKWEDVIKKLGTIVEDMVAPNIEFIAKKYFNLSNGRISVRTKAHYDGKEREFDVIAVYDGKVILNETKSNPKPEYACDFIDFIKSNEFFGYFPELAQKEIMPIFASLYIPENVLKLLSKNKIYAMGIREDTMDILNFPENK